MRIDLYDICGVIGGALMIWWSLASLDFSVRYDEHGKVANLKRAMLTLAILVGFLVVFLNVLNIFGISL